MHHVENHGKSQIAEREPIQAGSYTANATTMPQPEWSQRYNNSKPKKSTPNTTN